MVNDVHHEISRSLIASTSHFHIYFNSFHDGNQFIEDYLIIEPKVVVHDFISGVAVLPEVDGRFGLIRTFRRPMSLWVWELPRGFVETGETSEQSAARELSEETGLKCSVDSLVPLGFISPEAGLVSARIALFLARVSTIGTAHDATQQSGELAELRFFTLEEICAMIKEGIIEDPCIMAVVLRLR